MKKRQRIIRRILNYCDIYRNERALLDSMADSDLVELHNTLLIRLRIMVAFKFRHRK